MNIWYSGLTCGADRAGFDANWYVVQVSDSRNVGTGQR